MIEIGTPLAEAAWSRRASRASISRFRPTNPAGPAGSCAGAGPGAGAAGASGRAGADAARRKVSRSVPVSSSASASSRTVTGRGAAIRPASHLPTLRRLTPARSASSSWVMDRRRRWARTRSPNTDAPPSAATVKSGQSCQVAHGR
jgi:hypothetical protein